MKKTANFGGKKAAPFGSRQAKNTNRKKSATKTAQGLVKKTKRG